MTSGLFYLSGFLKIGLAALLGTFTFLIPQSVFDSWTTLISYARIFNGVFPVDTLFSVLNTWITFITGFYTIRFSLWISEKIPFIGLKPNGPIDKTRRKL